MCHISMDCSLSDFLLFRSQLFSRFPMLGELQDLKSGTVPSSLTVPVATFKLFCDIFSISTQHYEKLLVIRKTNRERKIVFCKVIGSVLRNTENAALPFVVCIGGSANRWNDDNLYFYREHGYQLQNGIFAANFKPLLSSSLLSETCNQHDSRECHELQFKWSINPSNSICQSTSPQSVVAGKLIVSIPFINFVDMTVAARIIRSFTQRNGNTDSDSDESYW